ncbi:Protein FAR1-RELATED SEQUENCE 5 [Hordeum vulgare]|nr:Protein FAR1-RELATED SEQUENCE 5 [Hordeum vulgare]
MKFEDFVPEADEYCFPGDDGISDEEDYEPIRLPSRRRRTLNKKERIWYDTSRHDAHEQFRIYLHFENVVEFREALRNYHVRTLRNFEYHRNDPSRIIAWCSDREHCFEFYITASKIAHEATFSINKMNLDHTCGASGENTKVTMNWVAKAVEGTVRSNPSVGVETILSYTKKKFGVHVPKSLAYRARRKAVDLVQGDHKTQYYRLRDYLECVLDTNPGSRRIGQTTLRDLELLQQLLLKE